MAGPDIPAAKRAGLPVDLDRLTAEGDDWLSAEERYALKMHGVCAQTQPHVFMVRVRTGTGGLTSAQARGLAAVADRHGHGWLHLTTRQQVELHHVEARAVTTVLGAVADLGLTTRSACGHTVRGVMACADAGVGLDEPFDCRPDAAAVVASLLARTPELDTRLPSRVNILFGGCPACRDHAKVNEAGFVSVVAEDGRLGYELWVGGSLGKSRPTLGFRAVPFVPRADVLAATAALIDLFVEYGDFETPLKARMKYLIAALGRRDFLELFGDAYEQARHRPWPAPAPVDAPEPATIARVLACAPPGGWSSAVRPQRTPGRALVTVHVPLGDLDADDLRVVADLADAVAGGTLTVTKNQDLLLRDVALADVPRVRAALEPAGLGLDGADLATDVRACTGGPVCSLAITPSQAVAARLLSDPVLRRNPGLRLAVSGCPNACAQHQIADLGFSGGRVTIAGTAMHGYQVWLGGDLRADRIGEVVGRIAERDVPAITAAVVGVWEALRDRGESLGDTVERVGMDAFRAQVGVVFDGLWAPGPEPADPPGGPGAGAPGPGGPGTGWPGTADGGRMATLAEARRVLPLAVAG